MKTLYQLSNYELIDAYRAHVIDNACNPSQADELMTEIFEDEIFSRMEGKVC